MGSLFVIHFFYLADAAKRKNLPAWIREGLEKMERDKQKKKEEEERRKKQLERKRPLWAKGDENDDENNDAEGGSNGTKGSAGGGNSTNPQGRQPESDEELPDDEEAIKESELIDEPRDVNERGDEVGPSRKKAATPPPIFLTAEEKEQQFALNVKRFMTEILITVLTDELDDISVEEIRRARNRVTAKPKKVTSALANIVGISKSGFLLDSLGNRGQKIIYLQQRHTKWNKGMQVHIPLTSQRTRALSY